MLVSLVTGGIATLNAAGFLLLAPGQQLAAYIACSSVFGVAGWLAVGILPAAWQFDGERMATLRVAQLWVVLAASGLMLATQLFALAMAFVVLLASESYFFFLSILLIKSQTKLFQRFELIRQSANTVMLVVTAAAFHASPLVYAWGLALVSLGGGLILMATGFHRPPIGRGQARSRDVIMEMRRALASRRLHALLAGRGVEMAALLTMTWLHWLGATLSLKVGLAIGNALASNARSRPARLIVAVATAIYAGGLGAILLVARLDSPLVPPTFRAIAPSDPLLGGPIALICLAFILIAWRSPDRPVPKWPPRWKRRGIAGIAE